MRRLHLGTLPLLLALAPRGAWATPAWNAGASLDQAEAALADGDFERARLLAGQAAAGGDPDALQLKADAALALGDRATALEALEEAAQRLDPVRAKALREQAAALRQAAAAPAATPVRVARALPSPVPTLVPTQAPTAVPTPSAAPTPEATAEAAAAVTAAPTAAPTAVPSAAADADLEAERRTVEAERAQLEAERSRLALEKERRALDAEKRKLAEERERLKDAAAAQPAAGATDAGGPQPEGGLGLAWSIHEPKYLSRLGEVYGQPMDLGAVVRWKGFVLDAGIFAAGLQVQVPNSNPCPTCPNTQSNSVDVNAPFVGLGYEIYPWKARPGQLRFYLPLGVRFTYNMLSYNNQTYSAPTLSGKIGLGLRWRVSRLIALDASGRIHFHFLGETFDSDSGQSLKDGGGQAYQPNMEGPEVRLGVDFYLW